MTFRFELPHAIVDLETTGFDEKQHRITEIAVIDLTQDPPHEWTTLVNPESPIPSRITQITGITDDMVRKAPTFAEIAGEVLERLQGKVVIAHNAPFDYKFLCAELARAGIEFEAETMCTVRLSRELYPQHDKHNLDSILARLGFEMESRHRALDDARALWHFLRAVNQDFPGFAERVI